MANLFGALNLNDTDRVFNATVGQRAIYDEVAKYLERHNADLQAAISLFVEGTTSDYTERYFLAGGGRLQQRGRSSAPGNVKASGSWDVAYPLYDYGAAVGGDDVSMAYMTAAQLSRHIQTVTIQDIGTVRFEILKALLNNTARTFVDPLWGSLSVKPLANGDGTSYPPVIGSESEADDTHHLETNYAASAISDTNNPIVTIVDELEEHFGVTTGGSNIVVFINNAQRAKIEALTDFSEVEDRFVRLGTTTDIATNLPSNLPGTVIGRCNGAWVVEWRWVPAAYLIGIHLDAPAPLKMRIDPADTGLGSGLQLVAREMDVPFDQSYWRHRFGIGVGNRLNGVVLECGTGGTYSIPSGYS